MLRDAPTGITDGECSRATMHQAHSLGPARGIARDHFTGAGPRLKRRGTEAGGRRGR